VGCAVLPGQPACADRSDCPTDHICDADSLCRPQQPIIESVEVPAPPPVEVLFVIDDSGSMCEQQDAIGRAFQGLLERVDLSAVDLRLATTTTDMKPKFSARRRPSPGSFELHWADPIPLPLICTDEATGMPFVPDTEGCDDLLAQGRLRPVFDSRSFVDAPEAAAAVLRCMVNKGIEGDFVQRGLEAMRWALTCDGPNAAFFGGCCGTEGYDPACPGEPPQFLRPDAHLLVVFVSYSDDCSNPRTDPVGTGPTICRTGPHDEDSDGVPDGYAADPSCADPAACYAAECGDMHAELCYLECSLAGATDPARGCPWFPELLTPVDEFERFLRGLKAREDRVSVLAITQPRLFTNEGFEVAFREPPEGCNDRFCVGHCGSGQPDFVEAIDACCPRGVCFGVPVSSCPAPGGNVPGALQDVAGEPGNRYLDLADRFGLFGERCEAGRCGDLCTGDYLEPLADALDAARRPLDLICPARAPACRVGDRPCATDVERRTPENYRLEVQLDCADPAAPGCDGSDVTIDPDALTCPHGVGVRITTPPPAGSTIVLRYLERAAARVIRLTGDPETRPIPDGDPSGIQPAVSTEATGRIAVARLELDIRHPSRGDLTVRVTHGGVTHTVVDATGQGRHNLVGRFLLDGFVGLPAAGPFTLTVADGFPEHEGALAQWAIELELE
jgi:hypothetical protein